MKSKCIFRETFKKLKIIVRYEKVFYRINIVDGIAILWQLVFLLVIRGSRLLKRVLLRSLNIIAVIICGILFGVLIIPLGISMEKYNTWCDGVWDLRTFILTSILIVFVNDNFSEERSRNQVLQKQYITYQFFMFDTEAYIKDLLDVFGYVCGNSSIFLTNDKRELFERELTELFCLDFVVDYDIKEKLVCINKKQINSLSNLLGYANTTDKLECDKESLRKDILYAINEIESQNLKILNHENYYGFNNVKKFIHDSLQYHNYIIGRLRVPWRWDHDRDMNIRKRLYYKGELVKDVGSPNDYWF